MSTHYEVLGVEPDTPRDEIREIYRARVAELSEAIAEPKRRDTDALREEKARLNAAWTVLADPYQRGRYDRELAEELEPDPTDGDDDEGTGPAGRSKPSFRERMRGGAEGATGGRGPGPDAAPVMKRLAAALMDVVVMGAFVLALAGVVGSTSDTVSPAVQAGVVALIVVFVGVYNVVPAVRTGQTLGHRLMHLKVVNADDGAAIDLRQAIRRYAIPVGLVALGNPFVMIALLLGLSFLFAQNRVSLLDRLARTRVVIAGG